MELTGEPNPLIVNHKPKIGKFKNVCSEISERLSNIPYDNGDISDVGITETHKTLRGEEIKDWLDNHPEVEDYAILDDDSDMLPEQFCKFHHCDPWFGLNPNHLYRINRQFEDNANYEYLSQTIE